MPLVLNIEAIPNLIVKPHGHDLFMVVDVGANRVVADHLPIETATVLAAGARIIKFLAPLYHHNSPLTPDLKTLFDHCGFQVMPVPAVRLADLRVTDPDIIGVNHDSISDPWPPPVSRRPQWRL